MCQLMISVFLRKRRLFFQRGSIHSSSSEGRSPESRREVLDSASLYSNKNRVFFALVLFGLMWGGLLEARDVPTLTGPVMDEAGLLSPVTRENLSQALVDFYQKSGAQLQLFTIPSIEGEELEDYSIRVVEKWKLGRKEKGSGVLLLIAFRDRQARIEVGEGIEGDLTDAESGRIIDHILVPEFRRGSYEIGIVRTLDAIAEELGGELAYAGEESETRGSTGVDLWAVFVFVFFLFILLCVRLFFPSTLWRSHGRGLFSGGGWGGGGFGAGLGGSGGWGGGGGGFSGGGASGRW